MADKKDEGKETQEKETKKTEEKEPELSEEDKQLQDELNMLVERLKESDQRLYKPALESLRSQIRASTTSMTSVPKPLKFLRPHYDSLKEVHEKIKDDETKRFCADIISVLGMTMSDGRDSLKFRLLGSKEEIGSWGHEYVRHLAGQVAQEWQETEESNKDMRENLLKMTKAIVPYHMDHNAEAEACDLLMEIEKLDLLKNYVDENAYPRVCLYLTSCVPYVPDPENTTLLKTAVELYRKFNQYPQALRFAMQLNDIALIEEIFLSCKDILMQKQLAYMLGRQQIFLELSDDVEEYDELTEIMSNANLNNNFMALARELDIMEPKIPEDIYKSHLEQTRSTLGPSNVDSARQNLASSFVNGFVNAGFGQDKILKEDGNKWLHKNKDHGMLSATASLGLVLLWDVDSGLTQIDKYLYSSEDFIKAGALLACGIVNSGVRNECDPALALLSDYVSHNTSMMRIGAIVGLGLAYAGSNREDVLALILPVLGESKANMEVVGMAALACGMISVGSCNGEVTSTILQTMMERPEADLKETYSKFLALGLALTYLGKQDAVDATLETLNVISEPLKSMARMMVDVCAYAGTGNVLKVQHLLHVCSEHDDSKDQDNNEKKDDKKKDKDKKEETPNADLSMQQGIAVLGIALISMGEEVGAEMSYRTFGHLLRYGEAAIKRAVPLALGLISVSNPKLQILDTLSKFSHDSDPEVAHNAILVQLPKANLVQRYLVFQLFVPRGKEFSFEIGIIDQRKNKRRLMFSSAQKDTHVTELHARIPLTILRRHMWLNLCVDLVSIVGETWRGQTYRSIESVCVSANCKLRRIFTLKSQPPDTAEDEEIYGCEPCNTGELEAIPKQCQFATDVQFVTQIFNMAKIKHAERLKGGDNSVRLSTEIDLNASGRRTSLNDSGYHIAFGTKVPGAPTSGKNKGNNTNRSNRSATSRADDPGESTYQDLSECLSREGGGFDTGGGGDRPQETVHRAVTHRRQFSDPATQQDLEMASRIDYVQPDLLVQPHPPREPSTDRLRRRIRVKNGSSSANKDRVSSAGSLKDEGISSASGTSSSKAPHSSHPGGSEDGRRQRLVSDTELIRKHGHKEKSPGKGSEEDSSPSFEFESGISLSQSYKKEYNRGDYEGDGAIMDDSLAGIIRALNSSPRGQYAEEEQYIEEYQESEEESESDDEPIYMFESKPKSAPRRHVSPFQPETEEDSGLHSLSTSTSQAKQQRGPRLEHDFVHSSDSSLEDEETQRRKKVPGSRPTSGSSSRPHSGSTTSRPQSGATSRPTSGSTSRPTSGTTSRPQSGSSRHHNVPRPTSAKSQGISSVKNSASSTGSPKCSKNVPKPSRKDKIDLSANHTPKSADSPELHMSSQLPTHRSDLMNGNVTNRSVSRMSRKSVKEIPKDDVRLSVIKSSEKPYDFTKYSAINFKMEDITDSFENGMFASMKRQTEKDYEDISASESPRKLVPPTPAGANSNKTPPNPSPREVDNNHRNLYDFSPTLTLTSDEDSTWQAPPTEMKLAVSTDTLTSSNPRDWSGAFSPPIVFPGGHPSDSIEDLSSCSLSPRKNIPPQDSKSQEQIYASLRQDDGRDEDDLDLLYDSCLNCYYDPKTQKYYELI